MSEVPATSLKKGAEIVLEIEKFADRGKSLGRSNGMVVFVSGAGPCDRVRARVIKKKKQFAEAKLLEVEVPSDLRTTPRCPYFGTCGGCRWQHVEYEAQLAAKRQSVEEALIHEGGFHGVDVRPTIPSPRVYLYRNKMEFSFSQQRWLTEQEIASGEDFDRRFALGLHAPGAFDKVLDLRECHLQSELSVRIVNTMRDIAQAHDWQPWSTRSHTGFLRHLVIRHGEHTGDTMVNLVTNGFDAERMDLLAEVFQRELPDVTTLVNTIHTGLGQTSIGEREEVIYGPGVLHDRIGDLTFEIAPNAFFQTNTRGAEQLYAVARDLADLRPTDLLYDLYCGAGTISLFLAPYVDRVVGVELVPEAVANARANAARNGISNATFHSGDMLKLLDRSFVEKHGMPDVLVVDPPRAGLHPRVAEQLADLAPERLVYISCNPRTQARDLAILARSYSINAVQPVDMFPQTYHVENVVRLTRKIDGQQF
ncbi:23S rRNA (uracil(1939)-C(5))-methyltransferase RlmD [soil metagenome]